MNKKIFAIAIALMLATVSIGYAMFVLWSRQPTLLVSNQLYTAELYQPTVNVIADKSVVATQWSRQPDDHHYQIAILVDAMNQIDTGILTVVVPDLNTTLTSLNISSVDVWTIHFSGSVWSITSTLNVATNQPLGTPISIAKSDVLYDTGINPPNTDKRAIIVTLSEYQLVPTTEPSTLYATTIELGV